MLVRTDCLFPTLYQIRRQGLFTTPVAYATAHVAAQFVKFFPRETPGVFAPEMLEADARRGIIAGARSTGIKITTKTKSSRAGEEDDEEV
jgi:hypothetical protein